ncbi:hypothetical protein HETIRDRAFT_419150 [Heterobasidion irregulare TC 32-1]|uniref:Uncharacterized protein n=1 Tax=Heterobasidion irregulare (strain TC 32-1) TaxID=747525 RepID=W4K0P7_HETIT|nr:uncharacterized protein HETIRDRAFT_419150 [Heterobasidion irregulare TC 32-1]ETW79403.1 hypothetical protein HETIRDRAFT_419150 [Heterobasidion irregulare TC 32-1]
MNGWTSPEGILYIKETLCTLLPWPNGPHNWQVNSTANILEGNNQLVIAACSEGKIAVAYLHLILISHLSKKPPRSLPSFVRSIQSTTVVLMIIPLIDVGLCQVEEMSRMGVRVVSLDKETVREAADFCEAYGQINCTIACIPVGIPVLVMSRTLGSEAETSLTKFLGFHDGTYQMI